MHNDKYILTVNIIQSNNIIYTKEELVTYIIDINNMIKTLDQLETQKLIIQRQMFFIESRMSSHVEAIERECALIRSHFSSFPIIKKIEHLSTRLIEITTNKEYNEPITVDTTVKMKIDNCFLKYINGTSSGNLCIINSYPVNPRIDEGYLRISLPIYNIESKFEVKNIETIYILPGGAVFYSDKQFHHYSTDGIPMIVIRTNDRTNYSIKLLSSYLKSSLFLWYCLYEFNSFDIGGPSFRRILIPNIDLSIEKNAKIIDNIETLFADILEKEKSFLNIVNSIEDKNIIQNKTYEYNISIQKEHYLIDRLFYKLFNLNDNEICVIEDYLINNKIFLPSNREEIANEHGI